MDMFDGYKNIFDIISAKYYSFTSSEKKVAKYILDNQDTTAFLSISELAENSGVSKATVSRFCRVLGYNGYNEFKLGIANGSIQFKSNSNPLSGEISEKDSLEIVSSKLLNVEYEAMTQTRSVLNYSRLSEAVTLFEHAKRVLCMGQGGTMLIANEAEHLFSTVTNNFISVADSHIQAIASTIIDPEDVVFYFSYSGATLDMMDTLSNAKENGAKVVLVTHFPHSPGTKFADVILQCGANENPLQSGSVATKIAMLYLVDILFSEYCRRNMESVRNNRIRIAETLSKKHL